MSKTEKKSSLDYVPIMNESNDSEKVTKDTEELNIVIRRVGMEDHLSIVKLFQTFDQEKYKFIQCPEIQNNNTATDIIKDSDNNTNIKTSLSLAGLRIDERGGIYLNPLLDTHSAYFKCYVAEDSRLGELVGYVLFFNTVDEKTTNSSSSFGTSSSSSSQSSNIHSQLTGGGSNAPHTGSNAHHDDPVAVIEDLYIKPQYRGYGIATQLWRKVLKSSLDRGCFGCECSLVSNNKKGLQFWRRKLGSNKVDSLLVQSQQQHAMLDNQSDPSNDPTHAKSNSEPFDNTGEIVIEMSRDEMKAYYEEAGESASYL